MNLKLTKSQEERLWLDRAVMARHDPWYLLKYFARTKDEHDPSVLFKKFPALAMYRFLYRVFNENDIIFIEKSRQIRLTWSVGIYLLHDAMFKKNRRIADQSKKQDDADGILERQRHVYKGLLEFEPIFEAAGGFPKAKTTGETAIGTKSQIEFPVNGSQILAIPQGDDVLASHTWSKIFGDEINLQPEFSAGFNVALPALSGGGGYIGAGTPYGKKAAYYLMHNRDPRNDRIIGDHKLDSRKVKNLSIEAPSNLPVMDKDFPEESKRRWIENEIVSMSDKDFNAIPIEELAACLPGIDYWVNTLGYSCIRVHYSADPGKDTKTREGMKWYSIERPKYALAYWEQHYEINYEAYVGRPVIQNWDRNLFVTNPEYDSNVPLRLSFDFGTSVCGCLFAQYVPLPKFSAHRLNLLNEVILKGSNTRELLDCVLDLLNSMYRRSWQNNSIYAYADPAGNQTRETTSDKSQSTSIKILNAGGIYPDSTKFGVVDTTVLLETVFALVLPDGKPAVALHERMSYFIGCFAGGLHYPETGRQGYYEKDDVWDHGGDIARYMFANCFDQFAVAGKQRPDIRNNDLIRQKYTGRVIGRRKRSRVESMRGTHSVYS